MKKCHCFDLYELCIHTIPYMLYIPLSICIYCVLSSVLPLRSVGRSNFDKGRHNLSTLINKKPTFINELLLYNGINSGQLTNKITK